MLVRMLALFTGLALGGSIALAQAQEQMPNQKQAGIERAVADAMQAEQEAFAAGDCETALGFLAEDSHFVIGGRAMPRAAMQAMCARIAAKGAPFEREVTGHDVYVLSSSVAYTVSTYSIGPPGQSAQATSNTQMVTKIWELREGKWRIVHFHESVTRPPSKG